MIRTTIIVLILRTLPSFAMPMMPADSVVENLELRIVPIGNTVVVGDRFTVIAELVNKSEKAFRLDSVSIFIPDELEYFYVIPAVGAQDLKPKSKLVWRLTFEPGDKGISHFSFNKIAFIPGAYDLSIVINFSKGTIHYGSPIEPNVLVHSDRISMKPPLSSLLIGGVMGSLLLTMFFLALKLKEQPFDNNWFRTISKSIVGKATHALLLFIFGSVVSVMTILIIQRTSDLKLPISISVEDYLGGIIVGMFSIKLGDTLNQMFIKKN